MTKFTNGFRAVFACGFALVALTIGVAQISGSLQAADSEYSYLPIILNESKHLLPPAGTDQPTSTPTAGTDQPTSTPTAGTEQPTSTPTAGTVPTRTPEPLPAPTLGDWVIFIGYGVVVHEITTVPADLWDGTEVTVVVELRNFVGDAELVVAPEFGQLVDTEGVKYSSETDVRLLLGNLSLDKNEATEGLLMFEIPNTVVYTAFEWGFVVGDDRLGTVTIDLGLH